MVEILTPDDYKSVINYLLTIDPGLVHYYWIALNDIEKEGDFVWGFNKTSQLSNYQLWLESQPDNHWQVENCVHLMEFAGNFGWNDIDCGTSGFGQNQIYAFCEKKILK